VERFASAGFDLILVDTSGRHCQDSQLFLEMQEMVTVISPNQIIFVMDSSIGQTALEQARAFKEAVQVGAIVLTKLDGHAKGGGAISAIAATKSPIIFVGTGEQLNEFQEFDAESFVSRLLGKFDAKGLSKLVKELATSDQKNTGVRIQRGKFTLRDMKEQLKSILQMGNLGQFLSLLPEGFPIRPGEIEEDSSRRLKNFVVIIDSMTEKELDDEKVINGSCLTRIARGSGRSVHEIQEVLKYFKQLKIIAKRSVCMNRDLKSLPPQFVQQFGGAHALTSMVRQIQGRNKQ